MLLLWIIGTIITEALTEVLVKSEIFSPARKKLKSTSTFVGKLIGCGYCTSFWVSIPVVILLGIPYGLTLIPVVDFLLWVVLFQRSSNILHNCIDKFTDKHYSSFHLSSIKDDE